MDKITGTIIGQVIDKQTNEPLIGANVVVLDTQLGGATDAQGRFRIERVPAGNYAVRALVIGYQTVTKTDVVVMPIRDAILDFRLQQSVINFAELTVRPDYFEAPSEKPISTQIQSNEEIRRLPGGLEDVIRAVSILPGVAQVDAGRNDLIVRGGAPSENLYVVDGFRFPISTILAPREPAADRRVSSTWISLKAPHFQPAALAPAMGIGLSSVLTLKLRDGSTRSAGQQNHCISYPVRPGCRRPGQEQRRLSPVRPTQLSGFYL
jgi:hypothetical protein